MPLQKWNQKATSDAIRTSPPIQEVSIPSAKAKLSASVAAARNHQTDQHAAERQGRRR